MGLGWQSVGVTKASHHFYGDIKFNKNYLPNLISVIRALYATPSHFCAGLVHGRNEGALNGDGLATK